MSNSHSELNTCLTGRTVPVFERSSKPSGPNRFAELPAEIRLQIWRDMFPRPRLVDFRACIYGKYERRTFAPELLNDQEPPITLFINHESREETLKHYAVFLRSARGEGELKMKPICFDWKKDTAAIPFQAIFTMQAPENLRYWEMNLERNGSRSAEFLGMIEDFHVHEVVWSNGVNLDVQDQLHGNIAREDSDTISICCIFQIFSNLKRLLFHMVNDQNHTAESMRMFGKRMKDFVAFHGGSFVEGRLPEVIIVRHGQTTIGEALVPSA
ncbi:hypothetical protein DL98DRAFT_604915 [Cadophora sp. DSE1049]|nr:hypothetical protein DL98DRAFT_604915 [Cadophora sp. DSE1049]